MADFAQGADRPVWFVSFHPARVLRQAAWWSRALHPEFRHVLACRPVGLDATLVANHTGARLLLEVAPVNCGDFLRRLIDDDGGRVFAAEADEARPGGALLRGPMTCVEATKALLGIRAPHVVTPWQLARHLARRGARPVERVQPSPQEA